MFYDKYRQGFVCEEMFIKPSVGYALKQLKSDFGALITGYVDCTGKSRENLLKYVGVIPDRIFSPTRTVLSLAAQDP